MTKGPRLDLEARGAAAADAVAHVQAHLMAAVGDARLLPPAQARAVAAMVVRRHGSEEQIKVYETALKKVKTQKMSAAAALGEEVSDEVKRVWAWNCLACRRVD